MAANLIFKMFYKLFPYYGIVIAIIGFISFFIHAIYCLFKKRNSEAINTLGLGFQFFCPIYLLCIIAYTDFNKIGISHLPAPFNIPIWILIICMCCSFFLTKNEGIHRRK